MCFFLSLSANIGDRHILNLKPEAGRALLAFHIAGLLEPGAQP